MPPQCPPARLQVVHGYLVPIQAASREPWNTTESPVAFHQDRPLLSAQPTWASSDPAALGLPNINLANLPSLFACRAFVASCKSDSTRPLSFSSSPISPKVPTPAAYPTASCVKRHPHVDDQKTGTSVSIFPFLSLHTYLARHQTLSRACRPFSTLHIATHCSAWPGLSCSVESRPSNTPSLSLGGSYLLGVGGRFCCLDRPLLHPAAAAA